ncbi:MAG TPA: hypothetical protein VEL74_11285 [Thermoanaerobaculia bacterium]|nr:hypothetical protein [Thermoanaerobaculia bacterium]
MARSSAQALVSPQRAGRRSQEGQPVQLDLFGPGTPALPAASIARELPPPTSRPTLVPHPCDPEAELLRRLNRWNNGRLRSLTFTDNRRTILTVRPGAPGDSSKLCLRIHRSFAVAPEEVLRAVATFVDSKRGSERARQALVVIREHFARHRQTEGRRRVPLRPAGEAYDLRRIADDLNQRYFEGRLTAEITWGRGPAGVAHRCRRGARSRTSSLQLGSYSYEDNLIRIHRLLDDPGIPRYVVEAVVYHELLHADMPPVIQNGRRLFHTPEFRRRERQFRQLGRADEWIQENLPDLLQARAESARRSRRKA